MGRRDFELVAVLLNCLPVMSLLRTKKYPPFTNFMVPVFTGCQDRFKKSLRFLVKNVAGFPQDVLTKILECSECSKFGHVIILFP
jgi:hypothetical protein